MFSMLTDMSPSAGAQFYSTQIPAMGMNITNIATHMQKPSVSVHPANRSQAAQLGPICVSLCVLVCVLDLLRYATIGC